MKKAFMLFGAALLVLSAASCQKQTPDGKAAITEFAVTKALNSGLDADVTATIDDAAKTITVIVPVDFAAKSIIPTFTATEHDVVTVSGSEITSKKSSIAFATGTEIKVEDPVSVLSTTYKLVVNYDDGKAVLTKVCFDKANNPLLTETVAPEEIEEIMIVRVPAAAFKQTLKLTVEGGSNDVVKVNGTVVSDGTPVDVDTSFPIDIIVNDPVASATKTYELKVGKILEYVVEKVGTFAEGTMATDFSMAINPTNNMPYFFYLRKVDADKYNIGAVTRLNGKTFEAVGGAMTDGSARAASKPVLAIASDGAIYAKYNGGEVASKPTVKKYTSSWETVGTAGFTSGNVNTSYYYPIIIKDGKPVFYFNGNTKNVASYRTMNVASFDGSAWSESVVTGTVPAYGSGSSASSGMYYTSVATNMGGKDYIASSFNEFGYYVHEVGSKGALTTCVENYIPSGSKCGLPGGIAIANDGKDLYVMAADWTATKMQVYKVDLAGKTLKEYGAGIPVSITSSGSVSTDTGFGIDATSGLMISVVGKDDDTPSVLYLNGSLQWESLKLEDAPASKTTYQVLFDGKGKGYIAYSSANGIEVYTVGLEADVLPQ